MKFVISFRGFFWFFRRAWYGKRLGYYHPDGTRSYLIDLGAFSIGLKFSPKEAMWKEDMKNSRNK